MLNILDWATRTSHGSMEHTKWKQTDCGSSPQDTVSLLGPSVLRKMAKMHYVMSARGVEPFHHLVTVAGRGQAKRDRPLTLCSENPVDPTPVPMGWVMTQVEVFDGGHHLCEAQVCLV